MLYVLSCPVLYCTGGAESSCGNASRLSTGGGGVAKPTGVISQDGPEKGKARPRARRRSSGEKQQMSLLAPDVSEPRGWNMHGQRKEFRSIIGDGAKRRVST